MRFLTFLLVTVCHFATAQGFIRTYGGSDDDDAFSFDQTSDGGFIIAGQTRSFGNGSNDLYIIKTDSLGDTVWTSTFGGSDGDLAHEVLQTTDNGYAIAGSRGGRTYVMKLEQNGDTAWSQKFEGVDSNALLELSSGGYFVTGTAGCRISLIKMDEFGNSIWTKYYGSNTFVACKRAYGILETLDGGIVIFGDVDTIGGTSEGALDFYLLKISNDGDSLWSKIYGDTTQNSGRKAVLTSDGGFVLLGNTRHTPPNHYGTSDIHILKTDALGNLLWEKYFDNGLDDGGSSIKQTSDGGFVIGGTTILDYEWEKDHAYLMKIDQYGTKLWDRTFSIDSNSNEWIWDIEVLEDDGYALVGSTEQYNIQEDDWSTDVLLIRTNALGNLSSASKVSYPPSKKEIVRIIDLLGKETKPEVNTIQVYQYSDGSFEKKVVIE